MNAQARAEDRLDDIFHALADRTRRALLARLRESSATISELARPFALSFPAVSKHLRVLEAAGLVSRSIEGRVHRCTARPQPMAEAEIWLEEYRTFWEQKLDALAAAIERPDRGGSA